MCDQIMSLSNQLIYNHRLVCGTQEVATRTMPIDIPAEFQSRLKPWLRTALDPSTQVVFLDTDQVRIIIFKLCTLFLTVTTDTSTRRAHGQSRWKSCRGVYHS